ncbi:MAG: prolyl-tRNA synthetase associated domain-containing protein [Hyphomicrobiales bacterium]
MPACPEDLFARLDELGIETTTHEHPPLYTVAQRPRLLGEIPGGHSKNLFMKDKKGRVVLASLQEDTDVDLKSFGQKVGIGRVSFGKPDLLMELLGVEPGGVTPFGLINDVEHRVAVVLEERLMAHDVLNFHPLTNAATTSIRPDDLLRFIRACGHEPKIMAVD